MLYPCFRLGCLTDYDEEDIWAFVQRHGGWMSLRQDSVDFWIREDYSLLLRTAWPLLSRQAALDYID